MDPANRFHSRGTFALVRLEYLLAFTSCVALGWVHRDAIDWLRYVLLFASIDLVGYLPGRIAHRRAGGRHVPSVYYILYNTTHSLAFAALIAVTWCLSLGPEWALIALPTHLCADRGIFGNVFKTSRLPFEGEGSGFERFEARLARRPS